MIINHNMASLNTYRQLSANNAATGKSLEKLSSGLRINRAGDDAAGLAISEKMRGQIRGLDQATRNAQDATSMLNTAEGNLNETHSILQRMKELATQASNDTNVGVDRGEIQKEINQLTSEINRIGNTTEFNTQKLLDGGASASGVSLSSTEAKGVAAQGGKIVALDQVDFTTKAPDTLTAADTLEITVKDAGGAAQVFSIDGAAFKTLWNQTDAGKAGASATEDMKKAALVDVLGRMTSTANTFELQDGTKRTVSLSEVVDINVSAEKIFSMQSKLGGQDITVGFTNTTDSMGTLLGLGNINTGGADITGKGTAAQEANIYGSLAIKTTDSLDYADWAGKSFTVTVNGRTATVNLAVDPTVADAKKQKITGAELVTAFNNAFDSAFGAGAVKASIATDPNKINDTNTYFQFKTDTTKFAKDAVNEVQPYVSIQGANLNKILGDYVPGSSASGGTFKATFQIGANMGQSMSIEINDMRSQALKISGTTASGNASVNGAVFAATQNVTNGTDNTNVEYALDVSDHNKATAAIKVLDNAINTVSAERSKIGAYTNRLEHTINNLGTSSENLTAAESRIRDVDMAKEMMSYQKNNILSQAATAMLAQANQQPQGVLQLLR